MSVGTGIFLGLASLSFVLLFTQTRETRAWRSLPKVVGFVVGTLFLLGLLWFGSTALNGYLHSRPHRVTTYSEITLGYSKTDVLYTKGNPSDVLVDDAPGDFPGRLKIEVSAIPKGKRPSDYQYWDYEPPDAGRLDVDYSPTSQRVVRIFCYSTNMNGPLRYCPELLGVSAGATEDDILTRLGKPTSSDLDEPSLVKILRYRQWNVAYYLERRRVYALEIESSDEAIAPRPHTSAVLGPNELAKKPVAECASARNADECADILGKAGKNPFDAYGVVGAEPVYGGQNEAPTPPVQE
jgi:hypothetical protein